MSRTHQQGFEARGLDLLRNYGSTGGGGTISITNAAAYLGIGYGLSLLSGGIGDDAWAQYELPAHVQASEAYIRIMMAVDNKNASPFSYFRILDDASGEIVRFIPGTGDINIIGVLQGNVGVRATSYERWELYIIVDDVVGEVTIRIDGTEVFTYTGDTKSGAGTNIWILRWHCHEQLGRTWKADDIAVNDTVNDGRGNDTWPGAGKIYGFRPSGLGPYREWGTRFPDTGEENWEDVDDGVPDDDTTYVQSTAAGQRDAHITENTPVGAYTVRPGCVQWSVDAKLVGAGPDQIASYIVKDGVTLQGNSRTPGATYNATHYLYDMLPTRPNGGEWLASDVDNTQFGYRAT